MLVQFVALDDLGDDALHGEIVGVQNRVGGADRLGVVRVARGGHRQAAQLRVFESVTIVAAQGRGGVEDFQRVDRQGFQDGKANAGAKQIVRMRRNGETAAFMNDLADFAGRFAFQIGKGRADAEEMSLRGGDFDAGNDEKIVHRQAVFAHQALFRGGK